MRAPPPFQMYSFSPDIKIAANDATIAKFFVYWFFYDYSLCFEKNKAIICLCVFWIHKVFNINYQDTILTELN